MEKVIESSPLSQSEAKEFLLSLDRLMRRLEEEKINPSTNENK